MAEPTPAQQDREGESEQGVRRACAAAPSELETIKAFTTSSLNSSAPSDSTAHGQISSAPQVITAVEPANCMHHADTFPPQYVVQAWNSTTKQEPNCSLLSGKVGATARTDQP